MCECVCMYVCVCVCIYIYIHTQTLYVCMCICTLYVYVYVYTHTHTYFAWYKHKEFLTFFPNHLRCSRFNITQKSAQGSVLLWNPNEFTESHRCPLSRSIINKSHPASCHLSKTAFCIILQLDVTKKKKLICLWYSCLVSIVHFCPFPLFQSDTHRNSQLYNKRFRNYLLTTQMHNM